MQFLKRMAVIALAGILAMGLVGAASAASEFEGRWKVKDTKGHPFEIVLAADGKATAEHKDKPMSGTWKEENGAAVITWTVAILISYAGTAIAATAQAIIFRRLTGWRDGAPLAPPDT